MNTATKEPPETQSSSAARVAEQNEGVAFLLKSVAAVTAIFTALGITGGVIGRMARNHDLATFLALGLAVAAVSIGVVATVLGHVGWQRRLLYLGLAAFPPARHSQSSLPCATWNDPVAPRVTASSEETTRGPVIVLDADAAALESEQRLTTTIWPLGEIRGPGYAPGRQDR